MKKKSIIIVIVGVLLFGGGITVGAAVSDFIFMEKNRVISKLQGDMQHYTESKVNHAELEDKIEEYYKKIRNELETHASNEGAIIRQEIDNYYDEQMNQIFSDEKIEEAKREISQEAENILQKEKQRLDEMINDILNENHLH